MNKKRFILFSQLCLLLCACSPFDNASESQSIDPNAPKYLITFKDENGTILQSSEFVEGSLPTYDGLLPTKASDDNYNYTFASWYPEIEHVKENTTYTASYTKGNKELSLSYMYGSYRVTGINSDSIEDVIIPSHYSTKENGWSSVKMINDSAFAFKTSIKQVELGDKINTIGEFAFNYCRSLLSIELPNSLTTIKNYAFVDCTSLKSIVIPENVTTINQYAFTGCSSLTIFCKQDSPLTSWSSSWNSDNRPVYFFSEEQPSSEGNYWHYVNGIPTIWE